MHDIRTIRDNPAAFDAALSRRGLAPASSQILAREEARRLHIKIAEDAQAEVNKASKEVGAAKARGDEVEFELLRKLVSDRKAAVLGARDVAKSKDTALTDLGLDADRSGGSPSILMNDKDSVTFCRPGLDLIKRASP